jgi:uncharacterized protein YcaQ
MALAAQGFDRPRPRAADDIRHYRRAMRAIRVLQLDFVNVLVPAHFLMIWSRLGHYDRAKFEGYLYDSREFTEQWAHEASIVAVSDWPLLEFRRRSWTPWKRDPLQTLEDPQAYLRSIMRQVRRQGPVTASDLPAAESLPSKPGDWHRPVQRWALEHHFGRGRLAVRKRLSNFQRVYELPERLIDDQHRSARVASRDAQRQLLRQSATALGVATLHDLADYYRMSPRIAAPRIRELVEAGELLSVRVEGWQQDAFMSPDARIPRSVHGASLLSPFDPLVWFRPRAERLFDFRYRIEIYVPESKRRWGYYVLPFRIGEHMVARVDLKADRSNSRLLVQRVHFEDGFDHKKTESALAGELGALAEWLGLESVVRY